MHCTFADLGSNKVSSTSSYISGFRKRHSCEAVLIRMFEHIKKSLDHGKIVCALLMDLSKAFDCISHKL